MNLKPCPSCGGKAELRMHIEHGGKKSWNVRCKNMCVVTCGHIDEKGRWRHTLRKEAIETWNKRAEIVDFPEFATGGVIEKPMVDVKCDPPEFIVPVKKFVEEMERLHSAVERNANANDKEN